MIHEGDIVRLKGEAWPEILTGDVTFGRGSVHKVESVKELPGAGIRFAVKFWVNLGLEFYVSDDPKHPWFVEVLGNPDKEREAYNSQEAERLESLLTYFGEDTHVLWSGAGGASESIGFEEDEVNPHHYKRSIEGLGVEVIDILEFFFGDDPLLFNAGKYLLRAGHKGDLVTDLEKLKWYVQRRIDKE